MHVPKSAILLFTASLILGACGDDEEPMGPVTFQFTLEGDASFQGPHGGQTMTAAVVRVSDGANVAQQSGVVSATADPSFSFTFAASVESGVTYVAHYWIDSNFGGGTAGVCDQPSTDHQWTTTEVVVSGNVTITESHVAGNVTDVCATFD